MNSRNVTMGSVVLFLFCWVVSLGVNAKSIPMHSIWVKDNAGNVVKDPQTSGLVYWREQFLSIGDGSADIPMRMQLLPIDPKSAVMSSETIELTQSPAVKKGCFSGYLDYGPDLEGLAVDPDDDNVFVIVTEDTYEFKLQGECLKRYGRSGSTPHPTLLLRAELVTPKQAMITHIKPVSFPLEYRVGNFPNDGIEGLVFGANRTLYLGLEKDVANQARIFQLDIDEHFWQRDGMAVVQDSQLQLPIHHDNKVHPINALAYYPVDAERGFLFAAARNDNRVWILDTAKQVDTVIVDMTFLAESLVQECPKWQEMDNYSIEGMTFIGDQLYLINDPWKVNYKKNALCEGMLPAYSDMAPLITSIKLDPSWVSTP